MLCGIGYNSKKALLGEMLMDCPWSGFEPATITFCERIVCGWITQPSNTWSNLAFIIVGILLVRMARREEQPKLILVGYSSIFLGFGSGLFHMTSAFVFEIFDLLGMFLISGLMLCLNLERLLSLRIQTVYSLFIAMTRASVLAMLLWKPAGIPIFAIQIAAAMTVEMLLHIRRDAIQYRYFMAMAGSFAFAFAIWTADITGYICDPDNHFITGHAVWHVLNSVAIFFIYKFYTQFKDGAKGRFTLEPR